VQKEKRRKGRLWRRTVWEKTDEECVETVWEKNRTWEKVRVYDFGGAENMR